MPNESVLQQVFTFQPLTPERWNDLERLFSEHTEHEEASGCWCMWWRLTRAQFARQLGEENKRAMKAIVDGGEVPGLLAYANGRPVAWCSLGAKKSFPALQRSRKLKPVDDKPVWSIVCFYVAKEFRGKGIMVPFLKAGIQHASRSGAEILEGYPVEPEGGKLGSASYMGVAPAFREVGFREIGRGAGNQLIMRYVLGQGD